jgi:hypothetical protein
MSVNRTNRILEGNTDKHYCREETRNITAYMMEIGPWNLYIYSLGTATPCNNIIIP